MPENEQANPKVEFNQALFEQAKLQQELRKTDAEISHEKRMQVLSEVLLHKIADLIVKGQLDEAKALKEFYDSLMPTLTQID